MNPCNPEQLAREKAAIVEQWIKDTLAREVPDVLAELKSVPEASIHDVLSWANIYREEHIPQRGSAWGYVLKRVVSGQHVELGRIMIILNLPSAWNRPPGFRTYSAAYGFR